MDELGLILGPYAAAIGNQYWLNNPFGGSEERFSRQKVGIFIVTIIIHHINREFASLDTRRLASLKE